MPYIQRDAQNRIIRVEQEPFTEMTEELDASDDELVAWNEQRSLLQLKQSDLDMIRVLEDLIDVLMRKGVLRITDLPPAAQQKLSSRHQARENLGGLTRLINEDEQGLI